MAVPGRERLLELAALGEDSKHQFKVDVRNVDSLASEMAALANASGGVVLIGVADDGTVPGLAPADVRRVNQLIGSAASQHVRSPLTVQTENVPVGDGRVVIVLTIPMGIDKPYFDRKGVIWLKSGADKRRINSKEELRRFFQLSHQVHGDELPTDAGTEALDRLRLRDFLRDVHGLEFPESEHDLHNLLRSMNLLSDSGRLNVAGVLLFGERPEWILPQFVVKAIRYPGDDIHLSQYLDTEDFSGPLPAVFDGAFGFVMRNLHKVQAGRDVNAPGVPEVPKSVLEELLVNALVHRDYMISAPIRLFVFDSRIEITSPGHLPNNLTVDKLRTGNANIRNPVLASFVAKGVLPYHGLGSGIPRALAAWPDIDLQDDRDGCLFTVTIHRKGVLDEAGTHAMDGGREFREDGGGLWGHRSTGKNRYPVVTPALEASSRTMKPTGKRVPSGAMPVGKTAGRLLALMSVRPGITVAEMAAETAITVDGVNYHLRRLRQAGRVERVGGRKFGHWEVFGTV